MSNLYTDFLFYTFTSHEKMIIIPIKTRIFQEGESLFSFIVEHIPMLEDGDVLVITSKIVALAEGRTFIAHTPEEKIEYIKSESTRYSRTKYVHLTIHDRMPMANA